MLYGGLLFDTSALHTSIFSMFSFISFHLNSGLKRLQLVLLVILCRNKRISSSCECRWYWILWFRIAENYNGYFDEFKNETNILALFGSLSLIGVSDPNLDRNDNCLVWAYRKIKMTVRNKSNFIFYPGSIVALAIIIGLVIGGARGGFRHSTRPIVMSNAGAMKTPHEMAIVLNTPFTLMHSFEIRGIKE